MSSGVEEYVLGRIAAAPVLREPFAHCVVDGIFPPDFYEDIMDLWPGEAAWRPLSESGRVSRDRYRERMIVPFDEQGFSRLESQRRVFWEGAVAGWLLEPPARQALLNKFADDLSASGGLAAAGEIIGDALLVSDRTDYAIGPHTDAPHRIVSLLFYLPEDGAFSRFGTSLYRPSDPTFRCRGGPHHPFELFERVKTIDFVPNRLVLFPKSDRCFHGVEPVTLPGIERRLLIYNVRRRRSGPVPGPTAPAQRSG